MKGLGRVHRLEVLRETGSGYFLGGAPFEIDILLPGSDVDEHLEPTEEIDVFIHLDSEDRPVATTKRPYAQVGDFAALKVVGSTNVGAFLDWGLPKDLFLPFGEQRDTAERGDIVLVAIFVDLETERIAASAKLDRFVGPPPRDLRDGDPVQLVIGRKSPLGFECLVNDDFLGLIHSAQVTSPIKTGDSVNGWIAKIRPDGKIDLSLTAPKGGSHEQIGQQILGLLEAGDGKLDLGDRSDPKLIHERLGCSKKEFKRALGKLYKAGKVIPGPRETRIKR